MIARSEVVALALVGPTAFPAGIAFSLATVVRAGDDSDFDPDFDTDLMFQHS